MVGSGGPKCRCGRWVSSFRSHDLAEKWQDPDLHKYVFLLGSAYILMYILFMYSVSQTICCFLCLSHLHIQHVLSIVVVGVGGHQVAASGVRTVGRQTATVCHALRCVRVFQLESCSSGSLLQSWRLASRLTFLFHGTNFRPFGGRFVVLFSHGGFYDKWANFSVFFGALLVVRDVASKEPPERLRAPPVPARRVRRKSAQACLWWNYTVAPVAQATLNSK